jgi:hypothetical protein
MIADIYIKEKSRNTQVANHLDSSIKDLEKEIDLLWKNLGG